MGVKAGESKTFNIKFPDDYPANATRRQGRDLCRDGKGGGSAGRRDHR